MIVLRVITGLLVIVSFGVLVMVTGLLVIVSFGVLVMVLAIAFSVIS